MAAATIASGITAVAMRAARTAAGAVGALLLSCGLLASACESPAGSGGQPVKEGLYLGDHVSFRVGGGELTQLRFVGIECRVPHPDNELVALCLLRAPGLPAGVVPLSGTEIAGEVEGVALAGQLGGDAASGTWTYRATCFDGTTCVAAGEWTASYTVETGGKMAMAAPAPAAPRWAARCSIPAGERRLAGGQAADRGCPFRIPRRRLRSPTTPRWPRPMPPTTSPECGS